MILYQFAKMMEERRQAGYEPEAGADVMALMQKEMQQGALHGGGAILGSGPAADSAYPYANDDDIHDFMY